MTISVAYNFRVTISELLDTGREVIHFFFSILLKWMSTSFRGICINPSAFPFPLSLSLTFSLYLDADSNILNNSICFLGLHFSVRYTE